MRTKDNLKGIWSIKEQTDWTSWNFKQREVESGASSKSTNFRLEKAQWRLKQVRLRAFRVKRDCHSIAQITWRILSINYRWDWAKTLSSDSSTWVRIRGNFKSNKERTIRRSGYIRAKSLVNENDIWAWQDKSF